MLWIKNKYLDMLREGTEEKDTSLPPEGRQPDDGMVISKPTLIHYAPNSALDSIKKNGLMSQEQLVQHDPKMKESLMKRYAPLIQKKLGVPPHRVTPGNVLELLKMWHPGHTKVTYAFFNRIPEGTGQYDEYLKDHTPIRISLSKLGASNDPYNVYGVNFPGTRRWKKIEGKHVNKLCGKNIDWYGWFKGADPQGFFNQVPHAAIQTPKGVIPPFTLKILDDKFER